MKFSLIYNFYSYNLIFWELFRIIFDEPVSTMRLL